MGIHPESVHRNLMHRAFFGVVAVRSHPESSTGNPYHSFVWSAGSDVVEHHGAHRAKGTSRWQNVTVTPLCRIGHLVDVVHDRLVRSPDLVRTPAVQHIYQASDSRPSSRTSVVAGGVTCRKIDFTGVDAAVAPLCDGVTSQ